ncbi:MAG: Threonine dehydratase biosynthetic, chloroplastic [Vezdaea aestivalis]|nr:MAG: Threonine dehydratase biosynthetic, chloroplastic [Vezdaea aestivalis]
MSEVSPTQSRPVSSLGSKKDYNLPNAYLLPNGTPDYLRLILTSRVYEVCQETPLVRATSLSTRFGCNVLLKREDLLPVFSFKLRGAYNKMAHLTDKERWKGVIAVSAGNHAQGVAFSARKLKIPATIVMPLGAPSIKTLNVTRLGGNVVLHGEDFDEAKAECHRREKDFGLTMVSPFDDPYVIAGQGTIGVEILRQTNLMDLEAVFCCIGGGGLIAGIGTYIKRVAPQVRIIGVETYDANAMVTSLRAKRRIKLDEVGLFADGAAVKHVGEETFRLCLDCVDDIVQVSTDEICAAIKDVFDDTRAILEPAGALALAGLKKWVPGHRESCSGKGMVAIASGANMNFDRLRFVAERAALGEKREALLSVVIPERPGAFAELVDGVLPLSITEFSYRYAEPGQASILMSVSVSARERDTAVDDLIDRLEKAGTKVQNISDNELAKSHIRYLVGGRSGVPDERLYAFEFPERPGALAKFLMKLKPGLNISLFHYRGHGGDVGKVLAGIQCPDKELANLEDFLRDLGYPWTDESDDLIYRQFMKLH